MNIPTYILKKWTKHHQPTIENSTLVQQLIGIHMSKTIHIKNVEPLVALADKLGDETSISILYNHWLKQHFFIKNIPSCFLRYAKYNPEEYKYHIQMLMEQEKPFRHMWIADIFKDNYVYAWDTWLVVPKHDLKWCLDHGLPWIRTASIRALECKAYDIVPDDAFDESQSDFWFKRFLRALEAKDCRKSSWIFQKCVKNDINKQYFYTTTCVSSPSTLEFETLPLPSMTTEHSSTQNFATLHPLRNQQNMHTSQSIFATNTMPS